MVNVDEKVNCIFWLAELKSITAVRRKFTSHYGKEAPTKIQLTTGSRSLSNLAQLMTNPDLGDANHARRMNVSHNLKIGLNNVSHMMA